MPDRPNILVLMTDQQRFDTIAAAGYPWMNTPHLDRLVAEGCLFTHGYTPNPICVPARHCFLTGTTEAGHGIVNNSMRTARLDGLPTLPSALSARGYFTAGIGKMHFHPPRRHHGFLELHLMEEIPGHRCDDAYAEHLAQQGFGEVRALHGVRPLVYHEPQRALVPEALHGTQFVADRTIEVLDRCLGDRDDRRRPFYLYSSWVKPHPPWNVPDEWRGLYDGVDLPEPVGERLAPAPTEPSSWFGDFDSPERIRAARAAYYTHISMIDAAIGRILERLEQHGVLDDTLVIFTSDHGEMLADHGLWQKMQPYEQAAHVPFIVRWPERFSPGSREERFVDLMDIMPTALDAAGIDPSSLDSARDWDPAGSSLLRLDEGGGRDRGIQRVGYGQGRDRWSMVRDARHKYVHFACGGVEWLFDLEADPHETRNLIGTDDLPRAAYDRLRERCVEEERRWGPAGVVVGDHLATFEPTGEAPPPRLTGRFPGWANQQIPQFGDGSPDDEARRLADEIAAALSYHNNPQYIADIAPEALWLEHFLGVLRKAGVSEAGVDEVAERLGLG